MRAPPLPQSLADGLAVAAVNACDTETDGALSGATVSTAVLWVYPAANSKFLSDANVSK